MSLWDEPQRARHHYVDAIIKQSNRNRVIWINRPYISTDSSVHEGIQDLSEQLIIVHLGKSLLPRFLPRTIEEIFNFDINKKKNIILNSLKNRNINNYVTICFDYKGLRILKSLSIDSPKFYFCNDFFGPIPKYLYQKRISRYVTGVICTDPRLKDFFLKFNHRVLFLPHGLHYFDNIEYKKRNIFKKLVYSGTLNFSLDYLFLTELVNSLDIELHLIGPIVEIDIQSKKILDSLLQHKRVKYYGHLDGIVERNLIIQECDICLLPYKKSFNGFVLKYFDYLHVGKPIFSTKYDSYWLPEYKKFVTFYDNSVDLFSQLKSLFDSYEKAVFEEMRCIAKESTWEARLKYLYRFINED
jgi:glycosyltransferase involved in cell wall biosynthesis